MVLACLACAQVFEYIPSRYSIASELEAKERVEGEAKRFAVSVLCCCREVEWTLGPDLKGPCWKAGRPWGR